MSNAENKTKKLSDIKKSEILNKYSNKEKIEINFSIDGQPEPYARARKGRAGFYNPKEKESKEYRKVFNSQVSEDQKNFIEKYKSSEYYYVKIHATFNVKINKSDSIEKTFLKENKIILPAVRNGDIDNYLKFILDALHEVIYDDDKCVISVSCDKFYSKNPSTEITAEIFAYDIK